VLFPVDNFLKCVVTEVDNCCF